MKSTELIEEIRQTENRSEIPYFDRTFDDREELLQEFNKAEELEKQAKSVFIANEQGLKEVSKYL